MSDNGHKRAPGPYEQEPYEAGPYDAVPYDQQTPVADPDQRSQRPDPRLRPPDPAGTQPKVREPSQRPEPIQIRRRELESGAAAREPERTLAVEHYPSREPRIARGNAVAAPAVGEVLPAGGGGVPATGGRLLASGEPPHAARFQFLFGALIALGAVAIAIMVYVVARGPAPAGPTWSAWQPINGGNPLQQIADHVAPEYVGSTGQPLTQIVGGPLTVDGIPAQLVLVDGTGNNLSTLPNAVVFQLCGSGTSCALVGKPSAQRLLLLGREALELALYTFHYISNVQNVVAILPPPPSTAASGATGSGSASSSGTASGGAASGSTRPSTIPQHSALLFTQDELSSALGRPLARTLSGPAPSLASVNSSRNAGFVQLLTKRSLYAYLPIDNQAQGQGPLLVLEPPGPALTGSALPTTSTGTGTTGP